MDDSSDNQQNGRAILCQQDGELSEFAEILKDLDVPIQQHAGKLPSPSDCEGASIAILHGRRLLDGHGPNLDRWPRTIAVIDTSSKTLTSSLNRTGAAMVIHRPIHPRALRLLLLHEIYCGPERRGKKRVLIGHPIQSKTGLFKSDATLLELSTTGARIETLNTPKIGSKIKLIVGKDLTLGKPMRLDGRVVRCIRPSGTMGRINGEIGVELSPSSGRAHAKTIQDILQRFVMGPAVWGGAESQQQPTTDSEDVETLSPEAEAAASAIAQPPAETPNLEATSKLPPQYTPSERPENTTASSVHIQPAPSAPAPAPPTTESIAAESDAAIPESEQGGRERRVDSRIPYERKIVALGEEAARVLIGQDLSQGGMRIGPNDSISVGNMLRVALHCGSELEPLVVIAEVMRDDGDKGLVLTFKDLSSNATDHLEKIIASSMPIQATPSASDPEADDVHAGSIVMGEMLETLDSPDLSEMAGSAGDAGEPVGDAR